MRVELPRRLRMPAFFLSLLLSVASGVAATAQTPRITLVVLAQQRMQPSGWSALAGALERSLNAEAARTPGPSVVELLRAEDIRPGLTVDRVVTLTLRGDCTLVPHPPASVSGALAWVPRTHGRIQPYIYVDCGRIARMLGPRALALDQPDRDRLMSAAIARVVEHEWRHIATQSSGHAASGLMQSRFTVMDLLADLRQHPLAVSGTTVQGR